MLSHSIFLGSNRSERQFIGDLTDLYKRHKVSCGNPRDLEHLDADLVFNEDFRTDLFTLCSAIGHMAEVEPSPEQLLTLVARAFGGPSISTTDGVVDVPDAAGTAFLDSYQRWCKREPEALSPSRALRSAPAASVQQRTTMYYADSRSELEFDKPFDDLPVSPASHSTQDAARHRSIPANTPLESLTLSELRQYLEDIESRVTRIEPLLEQAVSRVNRSAAYFEQLDHTDAWSIAEAKAAAELVAETVPQIAAAPVVAPVVEPVVWGAAAAVAADPVAEPVIREVEKEALEPVVETALEPVIETALEPDIVQALEPALEPPVEPVVMEAAAAVVADPVAEPVISEVEKLELEPASAPAVIEPLESSIRIVEMEPALAVASSSLTISSSELLVAKLPALKATSVPVANDTRLSRLRIINGVLVVLLIVAATAAAVFAYRYLKLPRTSTTIAEAIKSVPATLQSVLPGATKPANAKRPIVVSSKTTSGAQAPPKASTIDAAASNKPAASDLTSLYKNAHQTELPLADTHLDEKLDEQTHPAAPTFTRALVAPAPVPAPVPAPIAALSTATAAAAPAAASPADTHTLPPATHTVMPANVMVAVPAAALMANAISTPKPVYPSFRHIGVDSVVNVAATISKDGKVVSARSTDGTLDVRAAAVQAVQSWQFKPYVLEGNPVAVSTTFRFVFKGR